MNHENILSTPDECDVLVIGSGAGGMLAANRARDLGLNVMVIERSDRYGGTSALSGGGIWVPCNRDMGDKDSREDALTYLRACSQGRVAEEKLCAYVDTAATMIDYLSNEVETPCHAGFKWADYCQKLPGAKDGGRTMFPEPVDAGILGDDFFRQREPAAFSKLFGRISLSVDDGAVLGARGPGWRRHLLKLLSGYWLDFGWRRKTKRDRRLAMGAALVGGLRKGLYKRKVPLYLNTRFRRFVVENGRVAGVVVLREGNEITIRARHGVIAAAGGYEQNQVLRNQYYPVPTEVSWTITVPHNNVGDTLLAGMEIGAATDLLGVAWWIPSIRLPAIHTPNADTRAGLFTERCQPHSLCVNRTGQRFANEAISYHDFGAEMIKDYELTGANVPCWMIFDSQFRAKSILGSIMPAKLMPDSALPQEWWDSVIYRADSVRELARKIGVPDETLSATVARFNQFARTGVDEDFQRGKYSYDNVYCDPRHGPSPTLGALEKGPFYAVRLDLGDLGTLGGLKTDHNGQVIDTDGKLMPGLYAIGNCSASVAGGSYPGAGATLGPAMTFGYRAANHIAQEAARDRAPSAKRAPVRAVT
ncbi:FAD-dependent oxidoreductase [Paraburkholderia sp. HP33-1]|uniref:FAD-dependent oxidoreductase n=1 Tax=Paraburkholderia sp. HP33-1 TaxID=2883243 RepID=UPI001F3E1E32|nr:FAD-dependent oxidoreductase [Paraburkholderia sp. HP33-1]